ncbi:MAG TPA: response regulator [Pseudomonadales bacterium]|nr:response regulator [Pseudomonadales bacterium]
MDQPKILILDDEADWLEMCREMLAQLPSQPEIRTASTGAHAVAQLDAEPFRLLICDLKMPRIDGLQVLAIVRRRFPDLRTVVLTALEDEEFRSRAYALGVDLFWLKSDMQQNMKMFLDCLESLLGRDMAGGFRGIQNKSLMDIIQMECLSRNSTLLRLTRGPLVAKIWIQDGELFDAEVQGVSGETAFHKILNWKSGTFENLPPELGRPRAIEKSVNQLLLESAQSFDEQEQQQTEVIEKNAHRQNVWRISLMTREGAEFLVAVPPEGEPEAWGTQLAEQQAKWLKRAMEITRSLSEKVEAGPISHISGNSAERNVLAMTHGNKVFLVGWPHDKVDGSLLEKTRKLVASWDS